MRAAGPRGRVRNRYADPYADQYADPYAETAETAEAGQPDRPREDGAYRDGSHREGSHREGSDSSGSDRSGSHRDGGYQDAGYQDAGYQDAGYQDVGYEDRHDADRGYDDAAGHSDGYRGRRRAPDTVNGDGEDAGVGNELAGSDPEPEVLLPGLRISRRGRAAATRLRKSRRRVYRWSEFAIVIVLLAAGGVWVFGRSAPPAPAPWVTKLLAGEYKAVPNTCTAVTASVLNSYLPAAGRTERVSIGTSTDSQCSYTFDRQPTFLVLQISAQALRPFAAAGNDGSATANAQLSFVTARRALARPPKRSPLPPAVITPLVKFGQQAIIAVQHEHVSEIGTDVITVLVRERNVLLTVSVSGQESGHGFGPVPDATLTAAARAVAASVLAKAEREPTV
jgi:hypothetical protein